MIVIGDDLIKDGAALGEMKNCQITDPLSRGFGYLEAYEASSNSNQRISLADMTPRVKGSVFWFPEYRFS